MRLLASLFICAAMRQAIPVVFVSSLSASATSCICAIGLMFGSLFFISCKWSMPTHCQSCRRMPARAREQIWWTVYTPSSVIRTHWSSRENRLSASTAASSERVRSCTSS
uniref:Uncharacterized protein n=1 Tax=uncultured marine virus TaxID=186617 RepID=A0A0F7L7W6_9VIRU|nr:hypothetical protein [uncultured marine virus]